MALTCRNLIKIPYASMLKLVAGEEGMGNVILCSHVLEIIEYVEFVKKGDLIITLGYMMKNNIDKWKEFIDLICEKEIAGIVIDSERLNKKTVDALIRYCNEYQCPLFVMPIEMRMPRLQEIVSTVVYEEKMRSMMGEKFFLELMYNKLPLSLSRIKKAERYGFSERADYYFIDIECVFDKNLDFDKFEIYDKTYKGISGEVYKIYDEDIEEYLKESIDTCIKEFTQDGYVIANGEKITILIKVNNMAIGNIVEKVSKHLFKYGLQYRIGVSCKFKGLEKLNKAYEQSVFARHRCKYREAKYFENFGIEAIIRSNVDNELLNSICDCFLGGILEMEDEIKKMEIIKTLQEFINYDCNYEETAKVLYCHSNTVRNRINDIENKLQINHTKYNDMFNLKIALIIYNELNKKNL